MRMWRRIAGISGLLLVLLVASEFAVRWFLDPATADERAVLTAYWPTVQEQECLPGHTSAVTERPTNRQWLEITATESAGIEAASRLAKPRAVSLSIPGGWMLPALSGIFDAGTCKHPLRIGTPAIAGDLAFVTAASDEGVEASVYIRSKRGWVWTSVTGDGAPVIAY